MMHVLTDRIACIPSEEHLPGASSGQVRCSCRIELVSAVFVLPRNGRLPNRSSYLHQVSLNGLISGNHWMAYARMPSDQKSTGAE
jgi:hypothetical protein